MHAQKYKFLSLLFWSAMIVSVHVGLKWLASIKWAGLQRWMGLVWCMIDSLINDHGEMEWHSGRNMESGSDYGRQKKKRQSLWHLSQYPTTWDRVIWKATQIGLSASLPPWAFSPPTGTVIFKAIYVSEFDTLIIDTQIIVHICMHVYYAWPSEIVIANFFIDRAHTVLRFLPTRRPIYPRWKTPSSVSVLSVKLLSKCQSSFSLNHHQQLRCPTCQTDSFALWIRRSFLAIWLSILTFILM